MTPGAKVVSLYSDWKPAYGADDLAGPLPGFNEVVTVIERRNIGGSIFIALEGFPDDWLFWSVGFRPLRTN